MTYLPAPYESPQQDDLSATLCAILTTTVGLITSWVIGQHAYPVIKDYINGAMGNLSSDQEDALKASLDTALVPAVGWAVAAVLMVIGSLLLLFRRGRGLLVFGALVAIATTAWAQFGLGYGGEGADHPGQPMAAVLGRGGRRRAGDAARDEPLAGPQPKDPATVDSDRDNRIGRHFVAWHVIRRSGSGFSLDSPVTLL